MKAGLFVGVVSGVLAVSSATMARDFDNDKDRISYALGQVAATNIQQQYPDLNADLVAQAVKETLSGKGALSRQEMIDVLQTAKAGKQKREKMLAVESLSIGKAFLEENRNKDGIVVTESGLQYKVLKAGEGAKPTKADTVEVHYRGTLINGTEFDSSYSRGKTTSFGVGQVIQGWTEGLQLMSPGSKYMFYIPAHMAYGGKAVGQHIKPNSTLIFEVELVTIK